MRWRGLGIAAVFARFCLVGCENDYRYDPTRVESRLKFTCQDVDSEDKFKGLEMCYGKTRVGVKSQKVGWMSWSGPDGDLQAGQLGYNWYPQHVIATGNCIASSVDRFCRRRRICKMVESLHGWLLDGPSVYRENLYTLSSKNVKGYADMQDMTTDRCVVCQFTPCGAYTCPEGKVNGAALETVGGKVIRLPECGVSCAEGTYLTCKVGSECAYQVYTQEEARLDSGGALRGSYAWYRSNVLIQKVDVNIADIAKAIPPVQGCYPCHHAAWQVHHGTMAMTDDVLYDKGFLRFRCPGGSSAPERCGERQVTRFERATNTSSQCGCEPGFYLNSTVGKCAPCPAGFFCEWNGMSGPEPVECPADTYATGGAAKCERCNMDRQCENGQALTRCKPGQGGETKGIFQRENARCVSCQECQQLQGPTPCYRVSPKIF